jgi:hypothetical protein
MSNYGFTIAVPFKFKVVLRRVWGIEHMPKPARSLVTQKMGPPTIPPLGPITTLVLVVDMIVVNRVVVSPQSAVQPTSCHNPIPKNRSLTTSMIKDEGTIP